MNVCVECKHLILVWPTGHGAAQALGKKNYGCKASQLKPLLHPVTGEIWGGQSAVRIEEGVDSKTVALTFYAVCEDINMGDCGMYEAVL